MKGTPTSPPKGVKPDARTGARPAAGKAAPRSAGRGAASRPVRPAPDRPMAVRVGGTDPHGAIESTVRGLGFDLIEIERAARGLLRVTIDRRSDARYAQPGEFVTVDDCELVTRQLQYLLEVEGVDYARLEVSSPGLDRLLRDESDFRRFAGAEVKLTLREPLAGRKHFQGRLEPVLATEGAGSGWQLVWAEGKVEKTLGFGLAEVREARLVPVLDFKGRKGGSAAPAAGAAGTEPASAPDQTDGE